MIPITSIPERGYDRPYRPRANQNRVAARDWRQRAADGWPILRTVEGRMRPDTVRRTVRANPLKGHETDGADRADAKIPRLSDVAAAKSGSSRRLLSRLGIPLRHATGTRTKAESLREIAVGLNGRGIPTAWGGAWSAVQVKRVRERAA